MFRKKPVCFVPLWSVLIFQQVCVFGCSERPSPSVKELLDKLTNGDYVVKLEALNKLEELGVDAKPAIPTLIKIVGDEKATIPGAADAVNQGIIARPDEATASIRSAAAEVLGAIGPDAKPAIPTLLVALKDKYVFLRMASAKALADIGENEETILSALKESLTDPIADVKIEAAKALSELQSESQEAITTLTTLLKNKDSEKRYSAAYAFAEIRSTKIKTAIPDLIIALQDLKEDVRAITAQSLGSICEESATVIPALVERLEKDKSSKVRIQAAQALEEYGPEAKSAIPALRRATKEDQDADVQKFAAQAISRINTMPAKRGRRGSEEELLQLKTDDPKIKKMIDKLRKRRVRGKK